MISRLPRWVWFWAWALAFIAGMINVVGLLGFERQAVTHLTGTTTLLAAALAGGDIPAALHFGSLLLSFVAGTVLSGYLLRETPLELGRRHVVALLLESLLLGLAVPLLQRSQVFGLYAAACACGIQNAMVSTYSGAVVRTTHVSGMFTDLGISLGHFLRGLPVDARRLRLCALVISAFLAGGVVGTLAYRGLGPAALFIPSSLTGAVAVAYGLGRLGGRPGSSLPSA